MRPTQRPPAIRALIPVAVGFIGAGVGVALFVGFLSVAPQTLVQSLEATSSSADEGEVPLMVIAWLGAAVLGAGVALMVWWLVKHPLRKGRASAHQASSKSTPRET
jgi:galactitol-specific phosphotransferase system IIC component